MIEIPESGIEQFIRDLAAKHGVRYERTHGDKLAETFTRLSGDDVTPDEVELLTIALKRAGAITGREMGTLLVSYLREKNELPEPAQTHWQKQIAEEEARLAKALEELGKSQSMVYSDGKGGIWRRWPDGRVEFVRHVQRT